MRIVIEFSDVAKIIKELDACDEVPGVDSDAILDYVCGEYISGNRCIENVLAECAEGLCPVCDDDYSEVAYNKALARLHSLIVTIYETLDEFKLNHLPCHLYSDFCCNLRVVYQRRNLYVFELK